MTQTNFNMEDPTVQEKIRRGPHQYIPTMGKHGSYVPTDPSKNRAGNVAPYVEYPKMMLTADRFPKPEFKDFLRTSGGVEVPKDLALSNFQQALKDWDDALMRSVVHNKEQEREWLKANG
jgi:hypothetical protein